MINLRKIKELINGKTKFLSKIMEPVIIEKGYRPIGKVNTSKPPQGGSGVPQKIIKPKKES